jgi:hypothetical protein
MEPLTGLVMLVWPAERRNFHRSITAAVVMLVLLLSAQGGFRSVGISRVRCVQQFDQPAVAFASDGRVRGGGKLE